VKNIVIYGASGYVGQELLKLCANHPEINISGLSANASVGQDINFELKDKKKTKIKFEKVENIDLSNVDFVFNCLPNNKMHKVINYIDTSTRVIDLSIDFRLNNLSDYKSWYEFDHESNSKLDEFHYGLTEFNRDKIKISKHIANPGCYATSVLTPLLAIAETNLIEFKNIIVDAKSGYSGAGKTKTKQSLIDEVNENIKSYGIGDHKHIAEINQELSKFSSGGNCEIFFSANLIPVERGILSNIYLQCSDSNIDGIFKTIKNRFSEEQFIKVLDMNQIPETKDVINTNNLLIGIKKGYKSNMICIVSVIDNLLKGAAGQAMQNFNVMNGFTENLGIK
tara:strand:+ start:1165 stop:2178 length:1014 start_codon:yes stop_codon:yes gene_type:complete